MKILRTVSLMAMILLVSPAVSGVPDLVSFQGRLVSASGQSVTAPTALRFRIYRGGDDQTFPSAGLLVYHETTTATPTADGVFSHLIGSGTASGGCAEGLCDLSADDFGDGSIPVWIEVMVDPDGTLDSPDDDVLLPRTRIGSVGYAYHVKSIEGAAGGDLSGDLAAQHLTARTGMTLGRGADEDVALKFDLLTEDDPELRWDVGTGRFEFFDGMNEITLPRVSGELITDQGAQTLGGTKTFASELFLDQGLTLPSQRALSYGPYSNPTPGAYITTQTSAWPFSDGNLDGEPDVDHAYMVCYNCQEGSAWPNDPDEYSMNFSYEMTYAPYDGTRWVERNWNFWGGETHFRPFMFVLDTDFAGGYQNPKASWVFRTDPDTVGMRITNSGRVRIGDIDNPSHALEVGGAGNLLVDSPSILYFEGVTDDGVKTRLQAVDPTAGRLIELPDRNGRLAVAGSAGDTWIVMAADGSNTDVDTGDEVCAETSMVCDKTFDFGSATERGCDVLHSAGGHAGGDHLFQALCRAP